MKNKKTSLRAPKAAEGKTFTLALQEAQLMMDSTKLAERTRSQIIKDVSRIEGVAKVSGNNDCNIVIYTGLPFKHKIWDKIFKKVRMIVNARFAEQVARGRVPTGISCTGCDRFDTLPVQLVKPHKHVRVVFCGSCHRTWFRPNPRSNKWELAGENEAKELAKKYEVLEV